MRTIFKVRVISKDILSDTFARFRSIIGGRVKGYERAIHEAIDDAYAELVKEFPNVKNVRFGTTEMLSDGAEIIIYGEVTDQQYDEYIKRKAKNKK